jgi:Domain of unknown function (DUF4160)
MPVVKRESEWCIKVYGGPREHPPPHFHVVTSEANVPFLIENFAPVAGYVPRALRKRVKHDALEWARQNQETLRRKWNELHEPRSKR